jgi:hypothetical protein
MDTLHLDIDDTPAVGGASTGTAMISPDFRPRPAGLRSLSEYLARTVPAAQLIVLPDVSHFAPLQRPALQHESASTSPTTLSDSPHNGASRAFSWPVAWCRLRRGSRSQPHCSLPGASRHNPRGKLHREMLRLRRRLPGYVRDGCYSPTPRDEGAALRCASIRRSGTSHIRATRTYSATAIQRLTNVSGIAAA